MTSTKVRLAALPSFADAKWDVIIVPLNSKWEKDSLVSDLVKTFGKGLTAFLKAQRFSGKAGQTVVFPTFEKSSSGKNKTAGSLILVGIDKNPTNKPLADFAADGIRRAEKLSAKSAAIIIPKLSDKRMSEAVQNLSAGAVLGQYKFSKYKKSEKKEKPSVSQIEFLASGKLGKK